MLLKFLNPQFHKGVNVTVRRGIKWAIAATDVPEFGFPIVATNDPITADGKDKIVGFAMPISVIMKRFSDLTPQDIEREHDESCHTVEGLKHAMIAAYPDFDSDEVITIFKFEFKG